jgi:hypothetical protein
LKKYAVDPKLAVAKKRKNHRTLWLTGEGSSNKQKATIPNQRTIEAGAARIANGDTNIRRNRSALGRASISENHGVNIKTTKTPIHTTTHDE